MDIIDFSAAHAAAFKQLNLAWITEHWTVEAADLKALDSPFESIIDLGGAILIGEIGSEVVGTVALIPLEEGTLELAKMTVSKSARGTGLGLALGEPVRRAFAYGWRQSSRKEPQKYLYRCENIAYR